MINDGGGGGERRGARKRAVFLPSTFSPPPPPPPSFLLCPSLPSAPRPAPGYPPDKFRARPFFVFLRELTTMSKEHLQLKTTGSGKMRYSLSSTSPETKLEYSVNSYEYSEDKLAGKIMNTFLSLLALFNSHGVEPVTRPLQPFVFLAGNISKKLNTQASIVYRRCYILW